MEDRKKADLDRMFLEIESLIEKEKQEKEFNLENICDLSVILKKLASNIYSNINVERMFGVSKEYELKKLKSNKLYYDRAKKIEDYINLTLIKKLIDIETKNLKEEILKVKSMEILIDVINYLECLKENKKKYEKYKKEIEEEYRSYLNLLEDNGKINPN